MPPTSTTPKLPAELLLSAFSHLRRHDLAQVCKANSYLRGLARPLFYQFGTLTKFGLHFPGAPDPYPFLDTTELGCESLPGETLDRITSSLRVMELPVHAPSDCICFRRLHLEDRPCTADVLHIRCAVRVLEDAETKGPGGDFPHTQPFPTRSDRHVACGYSQSCDIRLCEYHCSFRSVLASSKSFDKVVIRNAPMGKSYYTERHLPVIAPSKEFVAVLDSDDIAASAEYKHGCHSTAWGLAPFWGSKTITIVFWTGGTSDKNWRPPCNNVNHDFLPSGPSFYIDGDGFYRDCDSMDCFWEDMGRRIGLLDDQQACSVLRFVNANTILESFVDPDRGEYHYQRIQGVQSIEATIRKGAKDVLRETDNTWEGNVHFLSIEEWVALGEWEDVFTRKEMAPFLSTGVATPEES